MYGCLTSAKYVHKLDVLVNQVSQDALSKAISREWVYDRTIKCYVNSVATDAVSDASSGKKFDDDYKEYEVIKIMSTERFSKRQRVTNIRGVGGNVMWTEDGIADEPTVFEIQGCYPRQDPFGRVIEYEILAKRVPVQSGR
jgi:hypothetical protein